MVGASVRRRDDGVNATVVTVCRESPLTHDARNRMITKLSSSIHAVFVSVFDAKYLM
jgi:hypothetical protein